MKAILIILSLFIAGSSTVFAQSAERRDAAEPLRLEDTIRGNKEQPRVLSIVPWQLPKYRPIEGALDWQPSLITPRPIHRDSFTRQLAIENIMQGESQTEKNN